MTADQDAFGVGSSGPSHRAPARSVQLSLPLVAIVLGMVSLLVITSVVVGFRMGGDGSAGQTGTSLAAQAATDEADMPPSLADRADATDDSADADPELPDPAAASAPVPGDDATAPKRDSTIEGPATRGMLHVKPKSVSIPAIKVTSSLVSLGLNPDNSLQVPEDYSKAGWFTKGSYPGDLGGPPALIVGHVDNKEGPAVFYKLDQLKIGDKIKVDRADGSTAVFVVYDGQQFPKDTLPTKEIYGDRKGSEVVLITCTGEFNPESGHYLDNYVVRAKLDPKASGLEA